MRLLVTGAGGRLGSRLAEAAAPAYQVYLHYHHLSDRGISPDTQAGDLSDTEHVHELAGTISPEIIINCAALADVDRCENEPEHSLSANVSAVKNLLERFPRAKFVQISTDYVFSGDDSYAASPPRPHDPTGPINIYGQHKLEAEHATLAASADNLVVRVNSLYDYAGKRNIFLNLVTDLAAGNKVTGLADQISNPIAAFSAAELILELIEKDAAGVYHVGGRDFVSRYEFACRVADVFGFDKGFVSSATMEDFPRPAKRPRYAGLDCTATEKFLHKAMPSLSDDLTRIKASWR